MTEDIEALKREIFEILMGVGGNDLSVVSIKIVDYLHRTGRLNAAPTSEDRQRALDAFRKADNAKDDNHRLEMLGLYADAYFNVIVSALASVAAPDVPVEITEEMEDAGNKVADEIAVSVNGKSYVHDCSIAEAVYKAMLSAAPQPKKEGE